MKTNPSENLDALTVTYINEKGEAKEMVVKPGDEDYDYYSEIFSEQQRAIELQAEAEHQELLEEAYRQKQSYSSSGGALH